jgi:transcriptional regulator with XRE-family HTH domain
VKILAKETFKNIRLLSGFSAAELARQAGVSKQQLGQVEKGINGISPSKAKAVIEVLGVNFDEVFTIAERGEKQ